jgi:hypothetical protein
MRGKWLVQIVTGDGCKKGKGMVLKIDNAPRSNLQSVGIERPWIVNRES